MTIDPEVAAILAALLGGTLAGTPRLQRSLRRRRRAVGACLECGRSVVFGQRTCDCEAPE